MNLKELIESMLDTSDAESKAAKIRDDIERESNEKWTSKIVPNTQGKGDKGRKPDEQFCE